MTDNVADAAGVGVGVGVEVLEGVVVAVGVGVLVASEATDCPRLALARFQ